MNMKAPMAAPATIGIVMPKINPISKGPNGGVEGGTEVTVTITISDDLSLAVLLQVILYSKTPVTVRSIGICTVVSFVIQDWGVP